MLKASPARLSLLCLALSLGACSSTPIRTVPWLSDSRQGAEPAVAGTLATESVGTFLQLPADKAVGAPQIEVLHEYQAASGRLCRQVQVSGESAVRVMCERGKAGWTFTRALVGSEGNTLTDEGSIVRTGSRRQAALPIAANNALQTLSESDHASMPSIEQELGDGESLWRFAARTTGNPVNWTLIAEMNGIDDPDRVRAGQKLNVPSHLVSGQR